jgi:hypothetical protein
MVSCILVAIAIRQLDFASDTGGSLARYAISEKRELTVQVAHSAIVAICLFALTDLWVWSVIRSERRPVAGRQLDRQRGLLRYTLSTALFCMSLPAMLSILLRLLLPARTTPTAASHFKAAVIDYLWDHQWLVLLVFSAVLASCVAVFATLRSRRHPKTASSRLFEFTRNRSWWILALPMVVVYYVCIDAPAAYLFRRPDIWIEEALPDVMSPAAFDVTKLRCDVSSNGTVRVVVLFNNDSSDTFGLDIDSLGVVLTEWSSMLVTAGNQEVVIKGPPSKVVRPSELDEHGMLVIPSKTAIALSLVYDKPGLSQANVNNVTMWLESSLRAQEITWGEEPACHLSLTAIDASDGREIRSEDLHSKKTNRSIFTEGSINID